MTWFKAFLAGFFSTLVFHQGLLAILHAAGASPRAPYSMDATAPFNVPAVLSLAFWGGVWGIILWLIIQPHQGSGLYWLLALIVAAPTRVILSEAKDLLWCFPTSVERIPPGLTAPRDEKPGRAAA